MLALISVSDKQGLLPFAEGLVTAGFRLLSTGGTLSALTAAGIPALSVAAHTGQAEILGGRVKTLHPRVHGGILGRPDLPSDAAELAAQDIPPIALVAVNLYPFRETVARGAPWEEIIENIDIGGPAMIRAAAKNADRVTVVVDPADYDGVLEALRRGGVSPAQRRTLQRKAFAHTAAYDGAIAAWMAGEAGDEGRFPDLLQPAFQRVQSLRYGENPHQAAAFYRSTSPEQGATVGGAKILQGKELSWNNLLDLDAALRLALEFPGHPAAVIIKHNTPCGVALDGSLEVAFRAAREADEVSAFGGIVALNRAVDGATARAMTEGFLEAVLAPSFSDEAREVLAAKKNLRLLEAGNGLLRGAQGRAPLELRSVSGGLLVQERDHAEPSQAWRTVTKRAPTEAEREALEFAWRVCKHVKSNAIVFANRSRLLAAGGGQTSRVDSVKIAAARGGDSLRGSAVASDAFFPFRDGLDAAAAAGASCVVQPGGSVRDAELIAAADEHGLAMVFTGVRHFRH
ncbi:MAG: bifunctional phosphoribosylaminoimidazolecarboxamide formyltransferase/IMP cyclohydrolase [Pseudomonadota bacterium]